MPYKVRLCKEKEEEMDTEEDYFDEDEFNKQLQQPLRSSVGGKIVNSDEVEWTSVLMPGVVRKGDDKRFNPTGLLAVSCDKSKNLTMGKVESRETLKMVKMSKKLQAERMRKFVVTYNQHSSLLRKTLRELSDLKLSFEEKYKLALNSLDTIHEMNLEVGMATFEMFLELNSKE